MNNLKTLSYEPGWMGGYYCVDGQRVDFTNSWKAGTIYLSNGKKYKIEVQAEFGSDDDMGHEYPWQLVHIGITDGELIPRFLSAKLLLKQFKVMVQDPRDVEYHTLGH